MLSLVFVYPYPNSFICRLVNIFSSFSRYLYWTDWGREAAIERIGMDGDPTTRQKLITSDIIWPNGLTLDFAQNKMYWVDSKLKRLEVANMDGSERKLLVHNGLSRPFALTNFENTLYWTDWESTGIRTLDKFKTPYEVKDFSANHQSPMGIKVLHPLMQPAGKAFRPSCCR